MRFSALVAAFLHFIFITAGQSYEDRFNRIIPEDDIDDEIECFEKKNAKFFFKPKKDNGDVVGAKKKTCKWLKRKKEKKIKKICSRQKGYENEEEDIYIKPAREVCLITCERCGDKSQSCDDYIIEYPVTQESAITWTNGGGKDSEWINTDNWQYGYLPGVHKLNRVVMASSDVATVNCAATYMDADVKLEMRSRATLDIQSDLTIGDELRLKSNSVLTQSNQSKLSIGKMLYLAASFFISDDSSLTIGADLYMATNGLLNISGDLSMISVSTICRITGQLTYKLGPTGSGTFNVDGRLIIAYATAKLTIDASSYTSGENILPLIQNAASVTGYFNPAKISIVGLPGGLTHQVKVENDGLYLELTGSNPTAATPSPTRSLTLAPNPSPTTSSTPSPTLAPIAPSPTPPPTPAPTAAPNTMDEFVMLIILTESGFDSITSSGTCPAPETTSIEIDGTAYIGGPGTISLYDCSFINSDFDIIDYKLLNFQDGLWFDISYSGNSIELNIKSLIDYSEYWNRVKNTFVGEYEESSSTTHFPDFSWDTIPTWVRFRKNLNINEFTEEELEVIGRNHYLSWYGLGTPEHVLDIAASIKGYDASHKMLLYWNAESYWGDEIETFNEDWLVDGETGTGGRGLYDHSNPEMRDWWVDHAKYMVEQDNIDGEFTDNSLSPECDNAGCNLELSTKSTMIKRLAEELPDNALKLGNFLRQYYDTGNRFRMAYTDGTYFENQHKTTGNQPDHEGIVVSMQMAREASWKKKVIMWTGSRRNCGCGYNNVPIGQVPDECIGFNQVNEEPTLLLQQDLYKSLGEFLMIVEEFSYINFNVSPDANCERWRWDSSGMEEFDRSLGEPKGPPLKIGDSFSRHFEHLSVKVNVATEETSIIWH